MPLFFQQDIDKDTRLAIWKIEEEESFFNVPLQRSITHPHKRLQHLAGRFLLRHLFPNFPLDLILIADTRKPYLENEAFHFSISHCGDYAAVIVSRNKRVGIDIEIPTEKVLRIRQKFLHEEELKALHDCSRSEVLETATLLWSAKEAMFKWWGRGEVDFSEMLRLHTGHLALSGSMQARFVRPGFVKDLDAQYRFFSGLVAAWVVTDQ